MVEILFKDGSSIGLMLVGIMLYGMFGGK